MEWRIGELAFKCFQEDECKDGYGDQGENSHDDKKNDPTILTLFVIHFCFSSNLNE